MYRTTSTATKVKIASLSAKPTKPAWLKLALHDAIHDKPMSLERERRMCAALGIEAPPPEYSVPACPGCGGEPHVGACHGNGGEAVVLADGETVRRFGPRRKRPCVRRPWMGAELSAAMDAADVTDADVRRLVAASIEIEITYAEPQAIERRS